MTGFSEPKRMKSGLMGRTVLLEPRMTYESTLGWMVFMGPEMTGMIIRILTHPPMCVLDLMVNSGRRMMRYGLMARIEYQEMRMT